MNTASFVTALRILRFGASATFFVAYPIGDTKLDKFPSRQRPTLAFHWLHGTLAELYRKGLLLGDSDMCAVEHC